MTTSETAPPTTADQARKSKLSLPALTAMVIGSMVGAGVFQLPARFAGQTGVYGALIAWGVAGLGMLTLALVFQSLANRKPKLANKLAYDTDMTARLWQVSADLVGMTPVIATIP